MTGGSMGGMALFSKPAISVTALKPPTQTLVRLNAKPLGAGPTQTLVGSNVNRRTLDGTHTQTLVYCDGTLPRPALATQTLVPRTQ